MGTGLAHKGEPSRKLYICSLLDSGFDFFPPGGPAKLDGSKMGNFGHVWAGRSRTDFKRFWDPSFRILIKMLVGNKFIFSLFHKALFEGMWISFFCLSPSLLLLLFLLFSSYWLRNRDRVSSQRAHPGNYTYVVVCFPDSIFSAGRSGQARLL